MKIAIIQDSGLNESLALTELIAYVEQTKRHFFELFLIHEEKNFETSIRSFHPDIFLIPSDLGAHHWTHSFAAYLKKQFNLPIVVGGAYPTFYPDEAIQGEFIDYLVCGEAEIPFLNLLNSLEEKSDPSFLPNIWGKNKNGIFKNKITDILADLESLPMPKREIYYKYPFIKNFKLKRFITGRGCVNQCTFCLNPLLKKQHPDHIPFLRKKSIERVIDEIVHVKKISPIQSIHFSDDLLVSNETWLKEFSVQYPKKIGIPFSCNLTIKQLEPKYIELLKSAGCRAVSVGVESGNEQIRKTWIEKNFENEDFIQKAAYLRKLDIMLVTSNMIGLPSETLDHSFETLLLNQAAKVGHARVTMSYLVPGTRMASNAKHQKMNMVIPETIGEYSDINSKTNNFENFVRPEFFNFFYLFSFAVHVPFLNFIFKRIIRKKHIRSLSIFRLISFYYEKKFLNIDWISGFIMFIRGGSPSQRTKNFPTLI